MKGGWGDGLVKQCLQCKHRDLGLDPQHVNKKSGICSSELGGGDRYVSGPHWQASLDEPRSSRLINRPVSK